MDKDKDKIISDSDSLLIRRRNEFAIMIDCDICRLKSLVDDYSRYIKGNPDAIEFFIEYIDRNINEKILDYLRSLK